VSGIARVLVVCGDGSSRVTEVLVREGFTVRQGAANDAVEMLDAVRPDIVVLELCGDCDVLAICAAVRNRSNVPTVIYGSDPGEELVVAGLAAGADAFITVPLGDHELVARLRALLRRSPHQLHDDDDLIEIGPIVLDRASRQLHVNGKQVPMPRREFDIAELLMRNAGRLVSRSLLLHELFDESPSAKSLDVQVGRLRGRLAAAEGRIRIATVRGRGYRFLNFDDDLVDLTASVQTTTTIAESV
jgi:DNA-binding response OmpR family regulator